MKNKSRVDRFDQTKPGHRSKRIARVLLIVRVAFLFSRDCQSPHNTRFGLYDANVESSASPVSFSTACNIIRSSNTILCSLQHSNGTRGERARG